MTTAAATKEEWWSLVRKDLANWNSKSHSDDRMSLSDWVDEVGRIYGWRPIRDRYGDLDIERV
jgi:hypothetical protein